MTLARGPDGRYHMAWLWRDTGDAGSCHDLCYTRSADHWEAGRSPCPSPSPTPPRAVAIPGGLGEDRRAGAGADPFRVADAQEEAPAPAPPPAAAAAAHPVAALRLPAGGERAAAGRPASCGSR